jgi:alpha-beta hydrolase superfamily lysophospholipase
MKKEDFTFPSADGRTNIHVKRWVPDGDVRAVVQIVHGMVEFVGRYSGFAAFLADHGFLVVGNDHLGHGESVVEDKDHGYFGQDGNSLLISDMHTLRTMTQAEYPNVPYFMLGHSMGSFFTRQYIIEHGEGLAGAIIMGTGWQSRAAIGFARGFCGFQGALLGQRHRSRIIDALAFGSNNRRFKPARTRSDWLTKDEEIVDWYCAEEWCQFRFTVNAYSAMFKAIKISQDRDLMKNIPDDLSLLFVSGADDPVGDFGNGVKKAYQEYCANTRCDIDIRLYRGDRHEILNELDKDKVYGDILKWLEKTMAGDSLHVHGDRI